MDLAVDTCYVAANCNHSPSIADWGRNNQICYGSCNAVLIYSPDHGSGGAIVRTLCGHTQRVTSVRWIRGRGEASETELVSGSADGTAVVWSLSEQGCKRCVLKGHESVVNMVDGLYKGESTVVVTVCMDSNGGIWYRPRQTDDFLQQQVLDFNPNICIGLRISSTPEERLIMACAIENGRINIYGEDNDVETLCFVKKVALEGHKNWTKGLDFRALENGDILLASGCLDGFIRLWRLTSTDLSASKHEINQIRVGNCTFKIYLESVLNGHEGWIYSVCWNSQKLQLLSASLDKSMIIWEFDEGTGLWLDKIRVGEVGGYTLGFYGGLFSADGNRIFAHGYHGSFHMWNCSENAEEWTPAITLGGHFNEVVDLAWEPEGKFLFSVSSDQTCRIHSPWRKDEEHVSTWHEIARPQVHGFDMSSIAVFSRYKYASSADEKVIRVFEAPSNFVNNFHRICGVAKAENEHSGPTGASVPSLGLSNKAIYESNNDEQSNVKGSKDPYPQESQFRAVELTEPPTEETLLESTLWPEVIKLYGHGYEVYSLAASPDGNFLASACKTTTAEHAAIILWDTSSDTLSWRQIQKLISHSLTVVQMSFSPNSLHLLSVSRDRRWSLFSKTETGFSLTATCDKKTSIHTRIIWCCAWTHDSEFFATGSRDGKVVVWTKNESKQIVNPLGKYQAASEVVELKNESVTAVAFASSLITNCYLLACGLESGVIDFYRWSSSGFEAIRRLYSWLVSTAHHSTVRRLAFRPTNGTKCDSDKVIQLASCSSDFSVRIYNLYCKKLTE